MRNLLICIFGFICLETNSQNINPSAYEQNLSKYWTYRERLTKYFMLGVGPNQGQSMPASERQLGVTLPLANQVTYNRLKFGDATAYLSQYIATLATEIRLLQLSNNDITNSVKELYFALYAFNRLDESAETYYGASSGDLNGFFIRDDITNLTSAQVNQLNDGLVDANNSPDFDRYIYFSESDYLEKNNLNEFVSQNSPVNIFTSKAYLNEMSKDQVYWMLMAFSLVKKCLPNTMGFTSYVGPNNYGIPENTQIPHFFQDGTFTFHMAVSEMTRRIFKHMRHKDPYGWKWNIENPTCIYDYVPAIQESFDIGNITVYYNQNGCSVKRGYDTWSFATPLEKIYTYITGSHLSVYLTNSSTISRFILSQIAWEYCQHNMLGDGEDSKIQMLDGLSNYWYGGNVNDNSENLFSRAHEKSFHWSPMLHAYLYDSDKDYSCDHYRFNFITLRNRFSAADCNNIYKYGMGVYGSAEWSTNSMMLYETSLLHTDGKILGDYNGLDYMLWHNLWYLYWSRITPSFLPPFTKKTQTTIYDWSPLPMPTYNPIFNYGFDQNTPFEYLAFDDMISASTILTTSNVKFRAGNSITLFAGFNTQSNSTFEAIVEPVSCDESNDIYREVTYGDTPSKQDSINKFHSSQASIFVYPSPANESIHTTGKLSESNQVIKIYSMSGQLVKTFYYDIIANQKFDILLSIENLKPGMYFIVIGQDKSKFIKW